MDQEGTGEEQGRSDASSSGEGAPRDATDAGVPRDASIWMDAGRWPPPRDAGVGYADASSSDHCVDAIHLLPGSTVRGSTCDGVIIGSITPCNIPASRPEVFFYVDAPEDAALHFTFSPGLTFMAYSGCVGDQPDECTGTNTTFDPSDNRQRLFGVQHNDDAGCGDYTLEVTQR